MDSTMNQRRAPVNAKKADIIIQKEIDMTSKLDYLIREIQKVNARLDALASKSGEGAIVAAMGEQFEALKREILYLATQNENVYSELQNQINTLSGTVSKVITEGEDGNMLILGGGGSAQIDYDVLAEKVAQILPPQEFMSPDYIACKVAEQIVIPESNAPITYNIENAPVPATNYAAVPVDVQINEEELADKIALKIGTIKAEDFDILVDDEGCTSVANGIVEKLDYDIISSAVAEKLRSQLEYIAGREYDYEEMATQLSERIAFTGLSEEAIAEKTAELLSEHLPEVDSDDIADKVVTQILQAEEEHGYEVVVDEDGIAKITEEVLKSTDERFDEVERELEVIRAMLEGGAIVREVAPAEAYAEQYVAEESTLVTVSDVMEEEVEEEAVEEEPEEVPEEEEDPQVTEIVELVEEIDEVPADGEYTEEDLEGGEDGVDFRNMMKFNRSFIARIIQSTDDQKEYYGRVKTALLSYAKVNSNIAWGAERFNKGRETIARFKIRGKTLCLYLALDPADFEYSVYHHFDVSDNKSMHGTPMMVKIKSARGAKKAIRLIDAMLAQRGGVKRAKSIERNYAAMYPYETMDELIEDGLVKDLRKK